MYIYVLWQCDSGYREGRRRTLLDRVIEVDAKGRDAGDEVWLQVW
jgi:hypothetical protein